MKFYEYLKEETLFSNMGAKSTNIDELESMIRKDCNPFLKKFGNHKIYRWMEDSATFLLKKTRNKRMAQGMSPMAEKILSDMLQFEGHNRRDKNVMIAASGKLLKPLFGNMFIVFPVGKFSFSYLEGVGDINLPEFWKGHAKKLAMDFKIFLECNFDTSQYENEGSMSVEKFMKLFKKLMTTDKVNGALFKNPTEIWFKCNSYYAISNKSSDMKELLNRFYK